MRAFFWSWVFLRRICVFGCIGFRPLGRVTSSKRRRSNQEGLPRTSGFSLRRKIPSLQRSFRGTLRRAVPGPSQLSRHPCRSTPETTLQRGLLNGAFGVCGHFSGRLQSQSQSQSRARVSMDSSLSLQGEGWGEGGSAFFQSACEQAHSQPLLPLT